MKKELKRALRASVLSAGAWAERATPETMTTIFPPHIPAGIVALNRAGRPDLIPAFVRRTQRCTTWDVTSLNDALYLAGHELK